jgi:hypothetical protein
MLQPNSRRSGAGSSSLSTGHLLTVQSLMCPVCILARDHTGDPSPPTSRIRCRRTSARGMDTDGRPPPESALGHGHGRFDFGQGPEICRSQEEDEWEGSWVVEVKSGDADKIRTRSIFRCRAQYSRHGSCIFTRGRAACAPKKSSSNPI